MSQKLWSCHWICTLQQEGIQVFLIKVNPNVAMDFCSLKVCHIKGGFLSFFGDVTNLVFTEVILMTFAAVAQSCKPGGTTLQKMLPLLDLCFSKSGSSIGTRNLFIKLIRCIFVLWLIICIVLLLRKMVINIAMLFCDQQSSRDKGRCLFREGEKQVKPLTFLRQC